MRVLTRVGIEKGAGACGGRGVVVVVLVVVVVVVVAAVVMRRGGESGASPHRASL
jgi:preprotein translocase subunit SecG